MKCHTNNVWLHSFVQHFIVKQLVDHITFQYQTNCQSYNISMSNTLSIVLHFNVKQLSIIIHFMIKHIKSTVLQSSFSLVNGTLTFFYHKALKLWSPQIHKQELYYLWQCIVQVLQLMWLIKNNSGYKTKRRHQNNGLIHVHGTK